MKNKKLVAVLKIVLVMLLSAFFGYLVLEPSSIEFTVKEKTQTEETNLEENEEVTDETENDAETSEDTEENTEEESKTKTFKNPLSFENINLGLDLAGGVSVVYEAKTEEIPTPEEMDSATALLRKRLTLSGNTEAEVSKQGDNRIRVEMPGVEDPQKAIEEVGQTAELKFYGIDRTDLYLSGSEGEYVFYEINEEGSITGFYLGGNIEEIGELIVTGQNIKDAYKQYGQFSDIGGTEPYVALEFDSEGTKLFADATEKYMNKIIAIVLDDTIISAPSVQVVIPDGKANITGMSGDEEAESLANLIKSGSLPFKLEAIESSIIGARLGEDALQTSIRAGFIGLICVVLFMIAIYAVQGILASLSLVIYLILVMMALALFNVTLTLPGIAGIILSLGMAVDANVIIFTRIKEEIKIGKTVPSAIKTGFEKGLSAIIDGNVTTLIIAGILYWKGIGIIRGFAQTLTIGIVLSMFTAIVITKLLLNLFVAIGVNKPIFFNVRQVKEEVTTSDLNKKHAKKEGTTKSKKK